jgi:hypothetical protein
MRLKICIGYRIAVTCGHFLGKGYKTIISQTSEPLQILDLLYRRGYRSNLIDRSLNKIIELERANNLKQASELQTKLQAYELQ